jgi:O-antigen/teichoic acid export membrane protein
MDDTTRRRLTVGFITTVISKMASTVIQVVQVPVLLAHWGPTLFGVWIILTGIPTYLSFSNVGFGAVAGNEMTMLMARGEQNEALAVFQSVWWLISITMGAVGLLFCLALYDLPVGRLLHLSGISEYDTKGALFWLGIALLFNQLETLLQAAYRCITRYSYGNFLKSALSLVAFAVQMVPVFMGYGPRTVAMVFAIANIGITLILIGCVKHDIPWISYGWGHARFSEIKRLARPSFAFVAYPLGNALNLQGSQMAVNYALGPVAVAVFSTARTVSRLGLQGMEIIKNTIWPELSIAFGAGNMELVRTLHRRACQIALAMSLSTVAVVAMLGNSVLRKWTLGKVPNSPWLVGILLLVVVVFSLWSTSMTLVQATNRHERLAAVYCLATGITCIATYFAARYVGLYGAAFSLLLSELIMNIYVLPESIKISHDTWRGFLAALVHHPEWLRAKSLWNRLRRLQLETIPPKLGPEI